MQLIDCPACKKTNRVDPTKKSRCGQCKHEFSPRDLTKARTEPFTLDQEEDDGPERCDECGRSLDEDGCCPKCD